MHCNVEKIIKTQRTIMSRYLASILNLKTHDYLFNVSLSVDFCA